MDSINEIGPLQRRVLFSSFTGWMFDGFETSSLILVASAAILSLDHNPDPDHVRFAVGSALGSTLMGWAIGGIIGSVMADRIGRKKMLIITVSGYCTLTALTALSNSVTMLIVLRFLTGMFLGSEWSAGAALVSETWPASARAKALGIMQSGYGFGFLLAAVVWLVLQPFVGPEGWRWMFIAGVLPAFLLIYIRRSVPESQLWLEATRDDAVPNERRTSKQTQHFSMSRGNARMLTNAFALLMMAIVSVAVFYGISALIGPYIGGIASQRGLARASWASISAIVYNGGSICGYIAGGFLADAIGRKPYMYVMFVGAILSGVLVYLAPQSPPGALASIFVLGAFTLGVFSWMPIYLPELFPTKIRSTASGIIFNLARLVAFPIPILTAHLFSAFGGFRPTVLSLTLLYIIGIVALSTLPETKGKPLPN
jgi:MFS family permease